MLRTSSTMRPLGMPFGLAEQIGARTYASRATWVILLSPNSALAARLAPAVTPIVTGSHPPPRRAASPVTIVIVAARMAPMVAGDCGDSAAARRNQARARKLNSAPARMPVGQRAVTVLSLV